MRIRAGPAGMYEFVLILEKPGMTLKSANGNGRHNEIIMSFATLCILLAQAAFGVPE